MSEEIRIINTTGLNNCGGRCVIRAHVRDGEIIKLTTEGPGENGGAPLCACARGLNYHRTFLSPDRLLYPMKRVGARGEGRFERISWDEALDTVARELVRVRETYGAASRYVHYGWGDSGVLNGTVLAKRLLALDGGYLNYYNSYSNACIDSVSRLMYGTTETGNTPEDWLNSRLIILWAHNPAETRFDAVTMQTLRRARDKGIPIIVVDPRRSDTVRALDAEWIPLKPATDAALMDAMAYVIIEHHLEDRAFLDRCCIGFDEAHMPQGIPQSESCLSYLTGKKDGVPKTPAWAEGITGVPAATIESLALRYAEAKPAALIQGYGAQRHACGEQSARGGIMLACMTGNVGVSGGWACGSGNATRHRIPEFPQIENPCDAAIPVYLWTDAVDHGHAMTKEDGVRGGGMRDIKLIMNLAGNALINQHGDINRTAQLLRDTSKCEFIVCSDIFMTPSAKFADILLPGASMLEVENMTFPWKYGDFVGYVNRIVEPLGECRCEYDWLRELAKRLGCGEAFSEGRDARGWLRHIYEGLRADAPELPGFDAFREAGIARYAESAPLIAFEKEARDPVRHPFPTKSGRIELFSEEVYRHPPRDHFPPVPGYVTPPEGADDPLSARYPIQLIGWHTKRRCHSVHDNNPVLERLDPQRLRIHPKDAEARGLRTGDVAEIFNDRGRTRAEVLVTNDVMPGVATLAQGAWYAPDASGTDTAGSINVLTSLRPTPYAKGNAQHTILVQIEKRKRDADVE